LSNLTQTIPRGEKTNIEKVKKGCLGCVGGVGIVVAIIFVVASLSSNDKKETTDAERVSQVPDSVANSPVAKEILTLTQENAYATGHADGIKDAKDLSGTISGTGEDYRVKIAQFRDVKNSVFDLMEVAQPKFNPVVFGEYKRGWNDGVNSFQPMLAGNSMGTAPSPVNKLRNSPTITKAEWKVLFGKANRGFAVSGSVLMRKQEFLDVCGEPNKTETVGDKVYWYYACRDGEIQLELSKGGLLQGTIVGPVNDY
jgi:hypothetical protein